jgi:hypothetical protein
MHKPRASQRAQAQWQRRRLHMPLAATLATASLCVLAASHRDHQSCSRQGAYSRRHTAEKALFWLAPPWLAAVGVGGVAGARGARRAPLAPCWPSASALSLPSRPLVMREIKESRLTIYFFIRPYDTPTPTPRPPYMLYARCPLRVRSCCAWVVSCALLHFYCVFLCLLCGALTKHLAPSFTYA